MSASTLAETINTTTKVAQEYVDIILGEFPLVQGFIEELRQFARDNGRQ